MIVQRSAQAKDKPDRLMWQVCVPVRACGTHPVPACCIAAGVSQLAWRRMMQHCYLLGLQTDCAGSGVCLSHSVVGCCWVCLCAVQITTTLPVRTSFYSQTSDMARIAFEALMHVCIFVVLSLQVRGAGHAGQWCPTGCSRGAVVACLGGTAQWAANASGTACCCYLTRQHTARGLTCACHLWLQVWQVTVCYKQHCTFKPWVKHMWNCFELLRCACPPAHRACAHESCLVGWDSLYRDSFCMAALHCWSVATSCFLGIMGTTSGCLCSRRLSCTAATSPCWHGWFSTGCCSRH